MLPSFLNVPLLIIISLNLVSTQAFCSKDLTDQFCVYSQDKSDSVEFRMVGPPNIGWMAIGFGSGMSNAEIYVGYLEGNTPKISHRSSTGYDLPPILPTADSTLVSAESGIKNGILIITFLVPKSRPPVNGQALVLNATPAKMIYASGTDKVVNNNFNYHDRSHAAVTAKLLDAASSYSSGKGPSETSAEVSTKEFYTNIHGLIMYVAWFAFAPLGIFIARFGKGRFKKWWYKLHLFCMLLGTFLLSIIGIVFIWLGKDASNSPHFALSTYSAIPVGAAHLIFGLFVVIISLLQSVLGFVIDKLFNPERTSIPWWDKVRTVKRKCTF
ncbi:hypothetical protein HK099_002662 [Clydaea vesicula]|uniref:DOMON domain-containing protein n=1 Tax=Clydaea vesicula TaxID=447962 RepID=A0AAD5UAC2_9FUNG|nr:hypothetical protein HK099_002662 [Clydaea vesicula]